ncbi:serine/threonine protein kinase [Leptolyngbya sp. FACHB-671]|uniref:serine/threonine-protein kinase n=1 Tax=Leptolyngbya sp. FACHB-671 TaxID=2692812 RepID=UPI00168447DE|nr:serine/threonine-protein kinase [Leptolyngbya sp. FACHB-671]MBD2069915.1 serine/threonine protein kinase [Leptolyngbya sp. FACHB-671]
MICCLNPRCRKPQNSDEAEVCQNCGTPLQALLRGRYRAVQLIGQGGFGRTYLAVDEDRLNTRCVIKQFSPQVQGTKSLDKAIRLFNQEAVRLHELGEHPQIPTLLAYFEQNKYLYLVQQFIEGQNLSQQLRRQGAFTEAQIRDVLNDLLPVLKFVHEHQVIHRDITPVNILRRQVDSRLVLIDFGVAKQLTAAVAVEPGTRIGTEGYSPLEQFRGGRAYPASDLYSLGATCVNLLTQTKPDSLYDPLNGRWIWRDYLLKKGVTVSNNLSRILDKMLKDLVNERYQSAEEILRDLNSVPFTSIPPLSNPAALPTNEASINPVSHPPSSSPLTSSPLPSRPRSGGQPGGSCLRVLTGHSSWVTSVALGPMAQTVASGSLDDTVKVWNLHTGELLFTLTGHTKEVNAIAISPHGKTLVSGSDDYSIKMWNLQTGALMRTLTGHSRDVNAVAVTPDGQLLVSGGEDRTIKLWQMGTGTLLRTLFGVAGMIKAIAVSSDGHLLVSGGLDHKIKLWSLHTGEQMAAWTGHVNSISAIAISKDGHLLASGGKDKLIKLWNLPSGELIRTFADHSRDVNAVAFSPNGKLMVSGSSDTTIKLWDLDKGKVIETWTDHSDTVNAIAISKDGKTLVSGGSDNTVRIWKLPV